MTMSVSILSALWDAHRQQVRIISPPRNSRRRAFLAVDLRGRSDVGKFEGALLAPFIHEWMRSHAITRFFLLLDRRREEFWRQPALRQDFQELLCFQSDSAAMRGCVWKGSFRPASEIERMLQLNRQAPLETIAAQQRAALLSSGQPLSLQTVLVPKPWGYEEWYTGVEKRGVARVRTAEGSTELPYALSLFRQCYLKNHAECPILLKTLNPAPQKVLGDLYLEMHEKKWEVYLVTEIDPTAWPSGVGIIKAGLHPGKVKAYRDCRGEDWLAPYLRNFESSLAAYADTRRRIDSLLDEMKIREHIDPHAPLPPETALQLLKKIPLVLQNEEKQRREELYDFVGNHQVGVGDVITFPPCHLHSLQHGIRVVEFQTPHYERLILMSGQKVLTQDYRDTAKALSLLKPEAYRSSPPQELGKTEEWQKERVVDFPDFSVERIIIRPGGEYSDKTGDDYHLWYGVKGEGTLHFSLDKKGGPVPAPQERRSQKPAFLQPANGLFLPVALQDYTVKNTSTTSLLCLKALPRP